MKNKRIWAITLLALVSVVVAACGPADGPADEAVSETRSLEGTTWVLESYLNSEGVLAEPLPISNVTAVFEDGQVSGNASCNSYFGSYEAGADGSLAIGTLGVTEMFCMIDELMGQERDVLAALTSSASYQITGDILQIGDASGEPVLVFAALKPAPLVGTRWGFAGFIDANGTARSALAGTEITATFDAEGKLAGSSGCNSYSTTYEVSGEELSITGPVASTMMMCPDPGTMEQEREYLEILDSVSLFTIEGKQLTLFNAEGQAVLTFVVQDPTPLAGTEWEVIGYNNGKGGVVSVVIGTELSALFGADGSLAGSAGCNNYSAAYEVDDASAAEGEISIGPAASTRMMCSEPDGIMEQEAQYLAALEMAKVYKVEGDRLQLRTADGALVADYRAK